MLSVDVVYEPEILPRLVLLKQHMQALQIELVLHERLPKTHSPRVVYAPRAVNSALHEAVEDDGESIGLYFYQASSVKNYTLPTDLTVALPTWPARSSDQAVAEFARYLHRPIGDAQEAAEQAAAEQHDTAYNSPDKGARRNIDWTGARNLVILIGMVVAATWLIEQIPDDPQSAEAESDTLPPTFAPNTSSTITQAVTTTAAFSTNSNESLPDRSVEPVPTSTVESTGVESCGGSSKDILRAVLTLQAATDFARCLNRKPPNQHRPNQHLPESTPGPVSDSSTRTTRPVHNQPTAPT